MINIHVCIHYIEFMHIYYNMYLNRYCTYVIMYMIYME